MTPLLPRTLTELDAWGVYAAQLIERGDRLSPEFTSMELLCHAVSVTRTALLALCTLNSNKATSSPPSSRAEA